jgi:hypothetical protein
MARPGPRARLRLYPIGIAMFKPADSITIGN